MKSYKLRRGMNLIEISDLRLNGRPLMSLVELRANRGPATLTFVNAVTSEQKAIVGGFKSLSGMDSETEVIEYNASVETLRYPLHSWTFVNELPAPFYPGSTKYTTIKLTRA
jgi:hypothetical protein